MIKYTSIKAVFNYLPDFVINTYSESKVLSWAFQAYRANVKSHQVKYDYKVCVSNVVDHKAKMPKDVLRIVGVWNFKESLKTLDLNKLQLPTEFYSHYNNFADEGDFRLIVSQMTLFQQIEPYLQPLRYVGNNPSILFNDCVNFFSDCDIQFSIDKEMEYITTSMDKGEIVFLYKSNVTDSVGDILVPDDPNLLNALGFHVLFRYYQNATTIPYREQRALEQDNQRMAFFYFDEFKKDYRLENFDVDRFASIYKNGRTKRLIGNSLASNG